MEMTADGWRLQGVLWCFIVVDHIIIHGGIYSYGYCGKRMYFGGTVMDKSGCKLITFGCWDCTMVLQFYYFIEQFITGNNIGIMIYTMFPNTGQSFNFFG